MLDIELVAVNDATRTEKHKARSPFAEFNSSVYIIFLLSAVMSVFLKVIVNAFLSKKKGTSLLFTRMLKFVIQWSLTILTCQKKKKIVLHDRTLLQHHE
jgi:hypothetical protein